MIGRWLLIGLALVAALPFGWMLGVFLAFLLLGSNMGVFPVLTIPLGWAAGFAVALVRWADPAVRLAVLAAGTIALGAFGYVFVK